MLGMDEQSTSCYGRAFYAAVLAACLNGVTVGNLAGWPQWAIPQLLSPPNGVGPVFTESEVSWIAGIFFLGMLAGGFVSLAVAGRFGKRKLFLSSTVPLVLGWSIVAVADSFWELILARVILGMGGGMMCHQTEMYLSEVSSRRIRSHMSVVFCGCVHVGMLLSYGLGPSLTISSATGFYLAVIMILASLYIFLAPETPFWLVRKGRNDEALDNLRKLRGRQDVHEEYEDIVEFVDRTKVVAETKSVFGNFTRVFADVASRKALLLVVLLTTAQIFSGMAAMMSYAQLIFERSVAIIPGRHVSLLFGLIEFLCTICSSCAIERVGRRRLIASSTCVCATCMALVGFYFNGLIVEERGILPVVCVGIFAIAYGIGLSTMATVVAAECLPMDARNFGAAAQNTTLCIFMLMVTKMWEVITTSYGQEYAFWSAAVITVAHTILLMSLLPETRGLSLTEIQLLLSGGASSKQSGPLLKEYKLVQIVPARSQEPCCRLPPV